MSSSTKHSSAGSFCEICGIYVPNETSLNAHLIGKKHLKNVERETEWKEVAERSIYVNGLKPLISAELQLADYFGNYGKIKKITLDKTHKNYAIIEMVDKVDVPSITNTTHHEISGVNVTVKPRELKSVKQSTKKKTKDHQLDKDVWKTLLQCQDAEEQIEVLKTSMELSAEEIHVRELIIQLLQTALQEGFPDCSIVPFGSSVNGFGVHNCDLDLHFQYSQIHPDVESGFQSVNIDSKSSSISTIITSESSMTLEKIKNKALEKMDSDSSDSGQNYSSADILQAVYVIIKQCIPDCVKVKPILHARLPVVRFQHKSSGIKCDISLSNEIAVENTKYLKFCTKLEPKFVDLTFFVRAWMKHWELAGGVHISGPRLNNYAATLLVLYYLQSTNRIPSLETMRSTLTKEKNWIGGWDCTFPDSVENVSTNCTETVMVLLSDFFQFYSSFEFDKIIFDTTAAKIIPLCALQSLDSTKSEGIVAGNWKEFKFGALNICDPFELNHNVAGNVNEKHMKIFVKCFHNAALATKMKLFQSKLGTGNTAWGILNLFIDHHNKISSEEKQQRVIESSDYSFAIDVNEKQIEAAAGFVVKVLQEVFMIKCEFTSFVQQPDFKLKSNNDVGDNSKTTDKKNIVAIKKASKAPIETHSCQEPSHINEPKSLKRSASPDSCGYCKRAKVVLSSPTADKIATTKLDFISTPVSVHCTATHRLWQGRRKARRKLVQKGLSDLLELEQLVSKLLLSDDLSLKSDDGNLNVSSTSTDSALLTLFTFELKMTTENVSTLNLEFTSFDGSGTDFVLFFRHLKTFLPGFIAKCLKKRTD